MDSKEFINKWLKHFAPNITKSQYNKRIKNQFIWHVFSWKIIPDNTYLEGDKARTAYNKADKQGAIYLQPDLYDTSLQLTEEFDKAEKTETPDNDFTEFYVVGKDFTWTYIVTHETDMGLGPYFMSLK